MTRLSQGSRERVFRDRTQPLVIYDDVDMFKKYCFTRAGVILLIDRLGGQLEHQTRRNHAVPPTQLEQPPRKKRTIKRKSVKFAIASDKLVYVQGKGRENKGQGPEAEDHEAQSVLRVFVALRFYATGSVLDNSAVHHGVSIPTASRTVRSVTQVLCGMRYQVKCLSIKCKMF